MSCLRWRLGKTDDETGPPLRRPLHLHGDISAEMTGQGPGQIEPQPRTPWGDRGTLNPIKSLENAIDFRLGDPRPFVLDFDKNLSRFVAVEAKQDLRLLTAVLDGVFDQGGPRCD
jgi:hypothetical protein